MDIWIRNRTYLHLVRPDGKFRLFVSINGMEEDRFSSNWFHLKTGCSVSNWGEKIDLDVVY